MYRPRRSLVVDMHKSDAERWLVSYADYMTLLFALFVVLYSMANMEREQFKKLQDTISQVFVTVDALGPGLTGPTEVPDTKVTADTQLLGDGVEQASGPGLQADHSSLEQLDERNLGKPLDGLQKDISRALRSLVENGLAKVKLEESWLTVELNSGLLFGSGSARASSSATAVMTELTTILQDANNFIRVRGYTDSIPINTEQFPSNWELSVARAASVVRLLEKSGIASPRLAIEGFGEYAPLADNSTAQGRAQNRKVVIALSKYGYEPAVEADTAIQPQAQTEAGRVEETTAEQEQKKIRVIRLPHGGIRITTRPPEAGEEEPPSEQEQ